MPTKLKRIEVTPADAQEYERIRHDAAEANLSMSAHLLLSAGYQAAERGKHFRSNNPRKRKAS